MLKAIEVTLSDGKTIMVHEPKTKELGLFLHSLPSLMKIGSALNQAKVAAGEYEEIPEGLVESIFPLMAALAGMTQAEYEELPMWDGISVLQALTELIPSDFQTARRTVSTESVSSNSGSSDSLMTPQTGLES